jgi:hypothetical protein
MLNQMQERLFPQTPPPSFLVRAWASVMGQLRFWAYQRQQRREARRRCFW